ncbi:MAG: hypothetical protein AAGE94_09140 [Acidobacteriota bacterium]
MEYSSIGFWLFLAATVVASLTFVAVIVWVEARRKERQEFYRFEFRKRMVDEGKMDATDLTGLMRYEHELRLRQGLEKLRTASVVILGTGIGTCVGLQFVGHSIWMVGLIPVAIGLCMLVYGFFFAAKPDPGTPPLGWGPRTHDGE